MIIIFLAEGFEEIEAVTAIDILRRAGLKVVTAGVGGVTITGSHGITITADTDDKSVQFGNMDAVVLPGGMPGTANLENSPIVQACIDAALKQSCWICAICAAPSVLGHRGLLGGHAATCYPGYETSLHGAAISGDSVVTSYPYITGRGAGVSADFALRIVSELVSPECAAQLRASMQCI